MRMTRSRSTLVRLLDDNGHFDLDARGTVNHMPMALVALSRMGASDERLNAFSHWRKERAVRCLGGNPSARSGRESGTGTSAMSGCSLPCPIASGAGSSIAAVPT